MPNKPSCILHTLHVFEGSSIQEETKRNEEKRKNKATYQVKMGSQLILVPFLLENGKTVKKFEFFRYILTATVKNTQKKIPEILGRNFGSFSPVLSPMKK